MPPATFATAINCIDGRVQIPVTTWLRERFMVEYVDLITYPGVDGLLSEHPDLASTTLRPHVALSVDRHAARVVAITAHHDCLGNPVADDLHRHHLQQSLQLLQSWNLGVEVLALWLTANAQIEVIQTRSSV